VEGIEPTRAQGPADFHTSYGFRRPHGIALGVSDEVWGLDYPFTVPRGV
jgi:hypothetical protein